MSKDLTFTKGTLFQEPKIAGLYRGLYYSIETYIAGKQICTGCTVFFSGFNKDCSLKIYPRSIFSLVNKLSSMTEVKTGDYHFDESFLILADNAYIIIDEIITPEIRKKLFNSVSYKSIMGTDQFKSIVVDNEKIRYERIDVITAVEELVIVSELLCDLAEAVIGDKEISSSPDKELTDDIINSSDLGDGSSSSLTPSGEQMCPFCNKAVPPGNSFCIHCGKNI